MQTDVFPQRGSVCKRKMILIATHLLSMLVHALDSKHDMSAEGRLDLTLIGPSTHERYVAHRFVNTRASRAFVSLTLFRFGFSPFHPSLSEARC